MSFKIYKQDEQALFSLDVDLKVLGDMLLSKDFSNMDYAFGIMRNAPVKFDWLLKYLSDYRTYDYRYEEACIKIKDLERRRQYLKRLKIKQNN